MAHPIFIAKHAEAAVPVERLRRRFADLSAVGATAGGGVDRQALTDADIEAHRLIISWALARKWRVEADRIGNLFITRPGTDASAAPIATGSHLDSQPKGGRFDGALGVLAGLEAMERLADLAVKAARPVQLIVWMNEEGCRFAPATMGSAVYAGELPLAQALSRKDPSGCSLANELTKYFDALALTPGDVSGRPHAYVEVHIEQGPVLEQGRAAIGAVTGVQGLLQFAVTVRGDTGHAGTVPCGSRRDAFAATIRIAEALRIALHDPEDVTRLTIGRCTLSPGSPNAIPHTTAFTIDLRHPDRATLLRLSQTLRRVAWEQAPPCTIEIEELIDSAPVLFADEVIAQISASARKFGHRVMRLVSGATHDSVMMAKLCPTGMIFIPCRQGISHREDEHAEFHHVLAAVDVLTDVIARLAQDGVAIPASRGRSSC